MTADDDIAVLWPEPRDWRADPPTERQMECIREIEEFSRYGPPPFTGTTKGEASDYIEKHGKLAYEDAGCPFFGY